MADITVSNFLPENAGVQAADVADIKISDFLLNRSQSEVAAIMGVTQGAVHQMIKAKREIYFKKQEDGTYTHYEIKRCIKKKAA
jgi:predicted transcriptional regulator